jgi:hypothetical protein
VLLAVAGRRSRSRIVSRGCTGKTVAWTDPRCRPRGVDVITFSGSTSGAASPGASMLAHPALIGTRRVSRLLCGPGPGSRSAVGPSTTVGCGGAASALAECVMREPEVVPDVEANNARVGRPGEAGPPARWGGGQHGPKGSARDPAGRPWLGDRRPLASVLLGFALRALALLVGRVLVRLERSARCAVGRGGRRRGRAVGLALPEPAPNAATPMAPPPSIDPAIAVARTAVRVRFTRISRSWADRSPPRSEVALDPDGTR